MSEIGIGELVQESDLEDITKEGDQSAVELYEIVRPRFDFENGRRIEKIPTIEELESGSVYLRDNSQLVGKVAEAWLHAFRESERLRWSDPASEDYWDGKSMSYYDVLDRLLWYGTRKSIWEGDKVEKEDVERLEKGGYGVVEELIKKETPGWEDVVKFLSYDLWLEWRWMVMSREQNETKLERKKELLRPLFEETIEVAAKAKRREVVRSVLEGFDNVGGEKEAEKLLISPRLGNRERLMVAVEHINVFGFIATVDLVAARSRDETSPDDLRDELSRLYERLQGEEVEEIALELSEVYEKVDFGEYELNQSDLTKREIERIMQAVKAYDNPRVLDLGAGVGRHAIGMSKKVADFIALEYEAKHVAKIKSQESEIEVVQGDWMELRKLVPERDFIYSLGRTIAHNRTPSDMFSMFGEVEGILSERGRFMFDLPDIDWGVYEDRIGRLRENLKSMGVEAYQSEIIFDGPNDINRFNRMIWRPEQLEAMAKLLGFKVLMTDSEIIDAEEKIKNRYYLLEKDSDFDPQAITPRELNENLKVLGLLDPGTDYNIYIEAWGMTLGQGLIYVHQAGLGNEHIKRMNREGRGPKVLVEFEGTQINLESQGMSRRDHEAAIQAKTRLG